MKNTDFKRDGKRNKDDGEYNYVCQSCQQKWKLKYPFQRHFPKAN